MLTLVVALSGALSGAAPAGTPAFTSASSAATATSATALTIDRPGGATAGKVLVAAVAFRVDAVAAITAPAGWADVVRTACNSAAGSLTQAIFVRVASAAEPAGYTFALATATGAAGSILAYSGVDVAQPIQAAGGRITRNSKGIIGPSITTTSPGALLMAAFAHSGLSAITPPAGLTIRADTTTGAAAPSARMLSADQLLVSAGATGDRKASAGQTNSCSVGQLVALRPAPDGPVSTSPPLVTGVAREGETLQATPGSWSGSPTSYAYQWERSGDGGATFTDIPGATGASHTLTSADVGSSVRVVVTASNAGGSASASSVATAVVEVASAPSNVAPPASTGIAQEGETLTATEGTWTGPPPSYAYAWERCDPAGQNCGPLAGADEATYEVTASDVGFTLRVLVTASNSSGSSTASAAPTSVVLPAAPVNLSSPVVTGTALEGETLQATPGSWSGSPTSYAYQWERSGDGGATFTDIPGATGASHTLTSADVGSSVRVVVTASNAGGSSAAGSAPMSAVLPLGPVSTSPPLVTGVAREGETLQATPGSWSGSPTSYAYQWERSGDGGATFTDIPGATGASHTLTSADVGSSVRVVVTASNAGGSASASSVATAVVEVASAPSNVAPPASTGIAQEGETLTATEGTWTGPPPSYAYAWERCDPAGQNCGPLAGADEATYEVTASDVGFTLRVLVTASNSSGSSTASAAPTSVVLPAAPVNLSSPVVTGTALEGETLQATPGSWSGSPTSYAYQWERCDQSGQTCSAVVWSTFDTHRLRPEDVGLTLRVVVTATNAGGPVPAASSGTAVVLPLPPLNDTPPTVSGVVEEGELLSATQGSWLSSGPLSYAFQWQRSSDGGASWTDIDDADAASYALTGADVGSVLRVVVTASNAGGFATAASDATATVTSTGRPVNVDPPSFSGYAQTGRILTAAVGSWVGSPTAYAYRWQRSSDAGQTWVDISGAESPSYASKTADLGSAVRVRVTASNEFGSGSATSYPAQIYPTGNLIVAVNVQWRCSSAVSLDLVKVTMTTRLADGVALANGCSGRVGRVEVETWTRDALTTLNASTNAAHDFVIESGFAICHDLSPGAHQDGWQAMGGARLTLRNFVIACGDMTDQFGTGVAQSVLVARAGAGATTPTDIVVEHSVLMPGAASTFALGESIRSGIRNSVLCPDRTGPVPFTDLGGAVDPVYEANEEPDVTDPRCASFAAALAWAD